MAFYFESLIVGQKASQLAENVYILVRDFPPDEKYALSDQLRRASISVMSNIAEGSGRSSNPDRIHFYTMARSSAMEVASQLILAKRFGYIKNQELNDASLGLIEEVTKILFSFSKK